MAIDNWFIRTIWDVMATPLVKLLLNSEVSISIDEVVLRRKFLNFLCHEGGGVTKRSLLLRTPTATCSCGQWKKTAGSRGSLKASWDEHVDDATPF